ncbi:MAG: tetratricopeptide repeat protein [Thermoanaerobaculia bacterium]
MSDERWDFSEELLGPSGNEWPGAGRILSKDEARFAAECLLSAPIPQRAARTAELYGDDPDILYTVLAVLRERWETVPAVVRDDAEYFYHFLEKVPRREKGKVNTGKFLFDERAFFLGEFALVAGTTSRNLSLRDEARQWFNRAENWFLMTKGAERNISRLSYQRLALLTEERRFAEVMELLPALIEAFEDQGMAQDELKCRILQGNALRETGRRREAIEVFREVCRQAGEIRSDRVLASGYVNLGQLHGELNESEEALAASRAAIPILRRLGNRIDVAKVQWGLGLLYRSQGNVPAAIEAFRSAQMEFEDIAMRADVAALHLVIADLLLDAGQEREARSEIQAALPAIDELKLVPEGIAALSLLRQSVDSQRINRGALRDLHGYFPRE